MPQNRYTFNIKVAQFDFDQVQIIARSNLASLLIHGHKKVQVFFDFPSIPTILCLLSTQIYPYPEILSVRDLRHYLVSTYLLQV